MDDAKIKLNALQELLLEVKLEIINKSKNPRLSDNKFARILGVSSGSLNQWINGNRLPEYGNALKLSKSPYIGEKIFDILGYDRPTLPASVTPELEFIADNWNDLPGDVQKEIFNSVKEYLDGQWRVRNNSDNREEVFS